MSFDLGAIKQQLYDNPLLWGKYYLEEYFRLPTPLFHLKIITKAITSRRFACAASRESAKSTIITLLLSSHKVFFKKKHFIVICMNTFAKAAGKLDSIKKAFKEFSRLQRDCPITLTRDAEGECIIRHPDGFETRILCKGAEQIGSIRGESFGAWRPDLIIVDDLEDDELVRSSGRRKTLREDFDNALVPAGDLETCDIWCIGTILHDDALMAKLVSQDEYQDYTKLFMQAAKDEITYESNWAEKWSSEYLRNLAKEKPAVFAKEYQNNPVSGEMCIFNKDSLRRWQTVNGNYILYGKDGNIEAKGSLKDCRAAIGCDLAWSDRRESDFSAIIPVLLTPENKYLVDDYYCQCRAKTDKIIALLFEYTKKYTELTGSAVQIGMEKSMIEQMTKWTAKQEMVKRNEYLTIKDIRWGADKVSRIQIVLEPKYHVGAMYHKSGMGELENQLLRFPAAKHDDALDALRAAVLLLATPKQKKVIVSDDDMFNKLREMTIAKKHGFAFGQRSRVREFLPSQRSPW